MDPCFAQIASAIQCKLSACISAHCMYEFSAIVHVCIIIFLICTIFLTRRLFNLYLHIFMQILGLYKRIFSFFSLNKISYSQAISH
jgi:hypothetical protein